MSAVLKKLAIAFGIALPFLLVVDLFQWFAPGPIHLIIIVCALFLFALLRLDSALSSRDTNFATTSLINYVNLVVLVLAIVMYFVQTNMDQGGKRGILGALFSDVHQLQKKMEIAFGPPALDTRQNNNTKTPVAANQDKPKTVTKKPSDSEAPALASTTEKPASKPDKKPEPVTPTMRAEQQLEKLGFKKNANDFYRALSQFNQAALPLYQTLGFSYRTPIGETKPGALVKLIVEKQANTEKVIGYYLQHGLNINDKFEYTVDGKAIKLGLLEIAIHAKHYTLVSFLKSKNIATPSALALVIKSLQDPKQKTEHAALAKVYQQLSGKPYQSQTAKIASNNKAPLDKNLERGLANAIRESQLTLIDRYLQKGAKVNKRLDSKEFPYPLFLAAQSPKAAAIVKRLLKAGAKPNLKSAYGFTALVKHVQLGRVQAVRLLIKAKAKVNIRAKDGSTALMYAAMDNQTSIIRLLLKAGAKVDTVMHNGMTALMKAAAEGHQRSAVLLLKNGANPNLRDRKGYSAINYASWNGHQGLAKRLLDRAKAKWTASVGQRNSN